MDVADLRLQLQLAVDSGKTPLLVNAMCGTTVLGAFDPLTSVADLCEEFGVWMHVDVSCVQCVVRT